MIRTLRNQLNQIAAGIAAPGECDKGPTCIVTKGRAVPGFGRLLSVSGFFRFRGRGMPGGSRASGKDHAALALAGGKTHGEAATAAGAFDTASERALVTGPLRARAVGTGLATQPTAAEISAEVDALMGRLTACGGACAADRTEVIVKAACSAVIGSASTLLQ